MAVSDKAYQKAYYASHREEKKAYQKAYDESHREEKKAYRAAHLKQEKARHKAYYTAHLKEEKAYQEAYYSSNRDLILAYRKAYYRSNHEKAKAQQKAYRTAHPDKLAAKWAARRARKRSATVGDNKQIAKFYRQARENKHLRCYLCGDPIPMGKRHVDHIVPLVKGGKHTASNLAIACAVCNLGKGEKMPEEIGILL